MSNLFFEIFKEEADHFNWSKHIEYYSKMEEISDKLRSEIIEAVEFLSKELGRSFLKNAGYMHPILGIVSNKAPWQMQELISFIRVMKTLKEFDSYKGFIDKLKSVDKCWSEGIPFLRILKSLIHEGFVVSVVSEVKGGKSPDLRLVNPINNESFFIEVTKLNASESKIRSRNNFNQLYVSLNLIPPVFPYSCRQLRELSNDEITDSLDIVKGLKERIINGESHIVYTDNKIELVIGDATTFNEIHSWCKTNNRRMGLMGTPQNFNETGRILKNNKLLDKARQLPKDNQGLIVMHVDSLYLQTMDVEETINRFQIQLNNFPNIFGVLLESYYFNVIEDEAVAIGNHYYSRKTLHEGLVRELLFIYNDKCDLVLSKNTVDRIYNSYNFSSIE